MSSIMLGGLIFVQSSFVIYVIGMADIRTMDLNLLRALDALLDERNVTRAALRLSLSQPAVSGMLTRLRRTFDDPLFVRTRHGIVPTARALEVAGPVKRLLSEIEGLLRPLEFNPATASFTFAIAATDYALRAVVVPFLSMLRPLAPSIRVAVRPVEGWHIQTLFEQGELDCALLTPDTTPLDLYSHRLYDETYVCAMRRDHPDAATGTISIERFCALDHALISYAGRAFRGVTDDALAAIGRERRVTLSVGSFLVLPDVLRTSDLIAVVPRRLVQDVDNLAVIEPPLPIPGFTKTAAWHARTHNDLGRRWMRSLLFDTCSSA